MGDKSELDFESSKEHNLCQCLSFSVLLGSGPLPHNGTNMAFQ